MGTQILNPFTLIRSRWATRSPGSQQSSLPLRSSHSPCEIHLAQSCCQDKAADQERLPVHRGQPSAHTSSGEALHASSSRRTSGVLLVHGHGQASGQQSTYRPTGQTRECALGSLWGDPAWDSHTPGLGELGRPSPLLGESSPEKGRRGGKEEKEEDKAFSCFPPQRFAGPASREHRILHLQRKMREARGQRKPLLSSLFLIFLCAPSPSPSTHTYPPCP